MRRPVVVLAALALFVAASSASARSWAQPQIKAAVESGLMGPSVAAFRPNAPLTRRDLATIVAGITRQDQLVADGDRSVPMTELNRAIVRSLGLGPAARELQRELRDAGLAPSKRSGWETVARLLALRFNHPAERDDRELLPSDPATRAEAAYSVARVLELSERDLRHVDDLASSFDLPALTEWQRRVLQRAVRFVGYPYVWGGTSASAQTLFGVTSRGGFDCSGFVWRVYKHPFVGAPRLSSRLRGSTSYKMAGEFPRAQRIALPALRPADVLFFGRGRTSKPSQVGHMGIYVGGGWFLHSSGQATTIAPLSCWSSASFDWGRLVIEEAGLA